jgi:hypothetical protein
MTGVDYSVALSRMTSAELANQFHRSGQFQMGLLQQVQRSA